MSSLPKRRRVKRVLVKRSQLGKNTVHKKRSYKPLYEKLRANNNALAKALSKEKQESQYLFSEKLGLTSEIQELRVACNKRDDIISGVLKKAKETLQALVTITNCVENTLATISMCQQVVATSQFTPRKSTVNDRRESSTRRLSGKSPARGVVQPMVGGHTITKPTINLSRLNIQREYRVQNPPNLSDIEESMTPEASPVTARTAAAPIPSIRPLRNYGVARVNRLPERIQTSLRTSDESERRSSVRSNRNSGRHSVRRSRDNSDRVSLPSASRRTSHVTADPQNGECLRSPRVALHDVSRLLHNSQSVNIRTLLENSSNMDTTQVSSELPLSESSALDESRELIPESSELSTTDHNVTEPNDPSESQTSDKNSRDASRHETEDPLEGPSWLLDSHETASASSANETTAMMNNSTPIASAKDRTRNNRTYENDESPRNAGETQSFVNSRSRNARPIDTTVEADNNEDADNDQQMTNPALRWANQQPNLFRNLIDDDDEDDYATSNIARFVTRKRGSRCDDCTDDFTLMLKPEHHRKGPITLNDLQLPVLESPMIKPAQPSTPEPEQTTNVQRITATYRFGNYTPHMPQLNGDETIFNQTDLMLPVIDEHRYSDRPAAIVEQKTDEDNSQSKKKKRRRERKKASTHSDSPSDSETAPTTNTDAARPTSIVEQESDDDDAQILKRKRKRNYNRHVSPDTPSDTEWAPTPKRKNVKVKRKPVKAKDPSSAKVVLQKLNDKHVKRRSPSPDPRTSREFDRRSKSMQRDTSSDSDVSSNPSVTTGVTSSRPRRQKAPTNLQEPSLGKKLRRQ